MKVELHLHTCRYSACAAATPFELMRRLIDTGYEAVYITEHDAVWADWEIAQLQAEFPSIRIFPGVEVSIGQEPIQHLLVLGANDPDYLALRAARPILEKARREGHLVVLAHPCRWQGADEILKNGLLPDALEYQTCNQNGKQSEEAERAAREFNLPLVNAGDTHALEFVDRFWIETARPVEHADDIRQIILAGDYANAANRKG